MKRRGMLISLLVVVGTLGFLVGAMIVIQKGKAVEVEPVNVKLTVNMSTQTGEVKHGASGFLYGLGTEQVPSTSLLVGLKPKITAQKPPQGLQHPGGDVIEMADTFLQAGGESIQIYCPDIHANWPYEEESKDMEAYEKKIKEMIRRVKAAGIQDKVVYVPFNEPEGQQYRTIWSGNNTQFFKDWKTIYSVIKKADPNAKIAGSNCCIYQALHTEEFIQFCADNRCIPDQFTWHILSCSELGSMKANLRKFRDLEKKLWIDTGKVKTKREVVINEYAEFTDLGVPGRLIPYVGIFEDEKVSACLAYWHISNNLDDLAADANQPNGAWWLYKWYGDMTGETVETSVEGTKDTSFYGVASHDSSQKYASVIFGGTTGTQTVKLTELNQVAEFVNTKKVRVKLERTYWTGINGACDEPDFLYEKILELDKSGNLEITVENTKESEGYHLTINPVSQDTLSGVVKQGPWKVSYEAENARLGGKTLIKGKDGKYACSGTGQAFMKAVGDSINFDVEVPEDGFYKLDMIYGAATGNNTGNVLKNNPKNANVKFSVDGLEKRTMMLQNTLSWYMSGMHTEYQYLRKGKHEIQFQATDGEGLASFDCLYLTYIGKEGTDVNARKYTKTYEVNQNVTSESVEEGGGSRIQACVNHNGIYEVKLRYKAEKAGTVLCYSDNTELLRSNQVKEVSVENTNGEWKDVVIHMYLQLGMNILDFGTSNETILIQTIQTSMKNSDTETAVIEAEDCETTGEVVVKESTHASGDKYVVGIKGDGNKKNSVTVKYCAKEAGEYQMTVYQSNKELFGNHSYNAQMVDRYVTMKLNEEIPFQVYFRNTYSEDSFRSKVISLQFKKGENVITLYNDNTRIIRNGVGGINVCENYTPNLDRFEITKKVVESGTLTDPDIPEKDLSTPRPTATPYQALMTPLVTEPIQKQNVNNVPKSVFNGLKKGQKISINKTIYAVTNVSKKEVAVVSTKKKTKVVIPATIKIGKVRCNVTEIQRKAFAQNKRIKSIVIGKNIRKIGSKAFYQAKSLRKIIIKGSKLDTVGKKAFKGINKKATIQCTKYRKKSLYKKLLKGGWKV